MKRSIAIILLMLSLVGLIVPLAGCSSQAGKAATTGNQVATVQRSDLSIEVTAAGNLAFSQTADLAFEIAGTVAEVLVEEGESVTKGQELATLDTSDWEDKVTSLERQVTAAERKLATGERAITTAERALATAEKQAESDVKAKQQALVQAEINLKNAEIAMEEAQDTYSPPDIEAAQAEVDRAETYLQYAIDKRAVSSDTATWDRVVEKAQSDLTAAEAQLNLLLTGADPDNIAIKKKQLTLVQDSYQDAQDAIPQAEEDGKVAIENAQVALENAKMDVEDAKAALEDVQKALDEANSSSPVVKAPFDGFVTIVNVEGGDEVYKGTVAVQIADPDKFEVDIMVSELDIQNVKIDGDAIVQIDSISGLSLPAKVTHISPKATISSGVVNYKVTVEIEALQTDSSEQKTVTAPQSTGIQAQQVIPKSYQLREGTTGTVAIIIKQSSNVLLVPSAAITREGPQSYVQVVSSDSTTEKRTIKTGLTDYTNTEVTEGLNEGEKVSIPQGTGSTSSSTDSQQRGGMMIPGVGGGPSPGG